MMLLFRLPERSRTNRMFRCSDEGGLQNKRITEPCNKSHCGTRGWGQLLNKYGINKSEKHQTVTSQYEHEAFEIYVPERLGPPPLYGPTTVVGRCEPPNPPMVWSPPAPSWATFGSAPIQYQRVTFCRPDGEIAIWRSMADGTMPWGGSPAPCAPWAEADGTIPLRWGTQSPAPIAHVLYKYPTGTYG